MNLLCQVYQLDITISTPNLTESNKSAKETKKDRKRKKKERKNQRKKEKREREKEKKKNIYRANHQKCPEIRGFRGYALCLKGTFLLVQIMTPIFALFAHVFLPSIWGENMGLFVFWSA